jgi:hypothetical protein
MRTNSREGFTSVEPRMAPHHRGGQKAEVFSTNVVMVLKTTKWETVQEVAGTSPSMQCFRSIPRFTRC